MKRPEIPKTHDPYKRESYEEYNKYFNQAEKYIDFLEKEIKHLAVKKFTFKIRLLKIKKMGEICREYEGKFKGKDNELSNSLKAIADKIEHLTEDIEQ